MLVASDFLKLEQLAVDVVLDNRVIDPLITTELVAVHLRPEILAKLLIEVKALSDSGLGIVVQKPVESDFRAALAFLIRSLEMDVVTDRGCPNRRQSQRIVNERRGHPRKYFVGGVSSRTRAQHKDKSCRQNQGKFLLQARNHGSHSE